MLIVEQNLKNLILKTKVRLSNVFIMAIIGNDTISDIKLINYKLKLKFRKTIILVG